MGGLSYQSGTKNRYRYNGKELHQEFNLRLYDYGARMYDPAIGRWNGVDPLAELDLGWSSYNFTLGNPINLIDPDGRSTHTDSLGNVVAVYNDDDNTVYRHEVLPENFATHENQVEIVTDPETGEQTLKYKVRLSGVEDMGETEYWDEFREHDNVTGATLTELAVDAKIMFGESWDETIESLNHISKVLGLSITALNSTPNEFFDIKRDTDLAPAGENTGKLLNGKYVTARSAGNYLAGMNGATGTIRGMHINEGMMMRLAGALHGKGPSGYPNYGEIWYATRQIRAGFKAGVKKRNR